MHESCKVRICDPDDIENVHNSMFKNNPSKDNLKKKNLKI